MALNGTAGSDGAARPPDDDATTVHDPTTVRATRSRARLPHLVRIPRTTMILLPVCFLYLYGIAWEILEAHYGGGGFDNRIFISIGQGTLSHGYPFETFRAASGRPFFDHTPLYAYFLLLPGAIAGSLRCDLGGRGRTPRSAPYSALPLSSSYSWST